MQSLHGTLLKIHVLYMLTLQDLGITAVLFGDILLCLTSDVLQIIREGA